VEIGDGKLHLFLKTDLRCSLLARLRSHWYVMLSRQNASTVKLNLANVFRIGLAATPVSLLGQVS
jgi:hypothetical protein